MVGMCTSEPGAINAFAPQPLVAGLVSFYSLRFWSKLPYTNFTLLSITVSYLDAHPRCAGMTEHGMRHSLDTLLLNRLRSFLLPNSF